MWKHCSKLPLVLHAVVLLWMCGSLAAQTQEPLPPEGPRADSRYADDVPANGGAAVELDSKITRNDNILSNNENRVGDNAFQEGALLDVWKTTPLWNLEITYHPTALFYQTYSAFNALDQNFKLDGGYHASPNLQFRWTESFQDTTGILESPSNEYFSLPTGPPPSLNATLFTPLARELANQTELHVVYDISHRSSIDVSGSYAFINFSGVGNSAPNLFNTQTGTGGLSYQYRLTRHFTIGGRYLFQEFHYGQGSPDGTQSMFLTALWEMRPHVTLSFFGGSQFSTAGGLFLLPMANVSAPGNAPPSGPAKEWVPAGGASLTLRSDRTVLRLTAQRLITDGGGLLTTVMNQYEGMELRRRLGYHLDLVLTAANARSVALFESPGNGAVDTQSAGIAIEHPVFEDLNIHFEYDFLRQRINQFVPFEANANINQYTVAISYRIGDHKD